MEAELLREMISDRDARILRIQRKTDELNDREAKLRKIKEDVTTESSSQANVHKQERKALIESYLGMIQKLKEMEINFRQQGQTLHSYASVVQKDRIGDSSYIMRMQAQLCKAMHSMGICDHQLNLLKTHCENLTRYHRDNITKLTEEKTQIELVLMNDLMLFDNERRKIEQNYKKQLDEIRKDREAIERQLEENKDDDDGSDENNDEEVDEEDEDDEEEKQIKEELMNVLQEKNSEIEKLRQESLERQEHIRELEEQLVELGAQVFRSKSLVKPAKDRAGSEEDDEEEEEEDEEEDEDDEEDGVVVLPPRFQNVSTSSAVQNKPSEESTEEEDDDNEEGSDENQMEDDDNEKNQVDENEGEVDSITGKSESNTTEPGEGAERLSHDDIFELREGANKATESHDANFAGDKDDPMESDEEKKESFNESNAH